MTRNAVIGVLVGMLVALPAFGQSEASHASSASLHASVQVPAAALDLLAAGAGFSVAALRPVGASVELVLVASADGVSFTVQLTADAVRAAGVAVGTAVGVTAINAGYLLSAGATVIAFVPSTAVAEMIHRRELRR
jgi:hypothetical protein